LRGQVSENVPAVKIKTEIKNSLPMTELGSIPSNRTSVFYRVESWNGRFIADFAIKSQAEEFAISDARTKGYRYDHKVSTMQMTRSK